MSQETVELVRRYLIAYGEGGTDAWATFWHPEINWRAMVGALDDIGVMHGPDAIRHYLSQWEETFDGIRTEPDEVIDAGGDQVLAVVHSVGRMKGSEAEIDIRYAIVFSIRDGKIAKGREFANREQALEAAGLSE